MRRPRHDAEVGPQPRRREAKTAERRADHVLADDQAAVPRDHDPVCGERAVRDVVALLLERGECGCQLADHRNDRVGAARPRERLGKTTPGSVGGDEREPVAEPQFLDRADGRKERMLKMAELLDTLAQRPLESDRRGKFRTEPEQLP